MGDLEQDSAVRGGPSGTHVGIVRPSWDGFGPNGGFLAVMSLRAAATAVRVTIPRTVQCQFLRAPSHGEITFTPTALSRSTRSDMVQVLAQQDGNTILAMLVRTLYPSDVGDTHDITRMPDVPDPDFLRSTEELFSPNVLAEVRRSFPLTANFEARPVTWERAWPPPRGKHPSYLAWCKFRPSAVFTDPMVNVGRYLVLLDCNVWGAVQRSTGGAPGLFARSTDLSVTAEDTGQSEEWLLCEVTVPVMRGGSISGTGRVWSRDGLLLAAGSMNMVYANHAGN